MAKISLSLAALDALVRGLNEAPEVTKTALEAATDSAVRMLRDTVVDEMPAVSGLTRDSVTYDVHVRPAGVLGVVGSASPVAAFLELGTKPHKHPFVSRRKDVAGPPRQSKRLAAIEQWVNAALNLRGKEGKRVAFAIARKIARDGTPARKFFEKAMESKEGQIVAIFERAAGDIAAHLAKGGSA